MNKALEPFATNISMKFKIESSYLSNVKNSSNNDENFTIRFNREKEIQTKVSIAKSFSSTISTNFMNDAALQMYLIKDETLQNISDELFEKFQKIFLIEEINLNFDEITKLYHLGKELGNDDCKKPLQNIIQEIEESQIDTKNVIELLKCKILMEYDETKQLEKEI